MPKDFTWGPVSRPNAATGRDLWLLTPLKHIIGHIFPQVCEKKFHKEKCFRVAETSIYFIAHAM